MLESTLITHFILVYYELLRNYAYPLVKIVFYHALMLINQCIVNMFKVPGEIELLLV